jgi:hypothetical protein
MGVEAVCQKMRDGDGRRTIARKRGLSAFCKVRSWALSGRTFADGAPAGRMHRIDTHYAQA